MADVSTTTSQLKIDTYYVDGDTRVITLKNPKGTISTSEITDLEAYMRANNVIVGDKMAGTFGKISSIIKVTEGRTYLDFS